MIVTLCGRVGYATVEALDRVLADAIAPGTTAATVDLSGVDYMSGAGAARLGDLATTLKRSGGGLTLRGLQEPVRQVLAYLGVLSKAAVERGPP